MDIDEWAKDIGTWADEIKVVTAKEISQFTRGLFTSVVMNSPEPVGGLAPTGKFSSGHFVHNWNVGKSIEIGEVAGTETKMNKVAKIKQEITDDFFLVNREAYLSNSTSYAYDVEYNGWRITPAYKPIQYAYDLYVAGQAPIARSIAGVI